MVSGRQGNADPGEDDGDAEDLGRIQEGAEPEPFDHRGEGGCEALDQQHGAGAAEAGERLKKSRVANSHAEKTAQKKEREGGAFQAGAEGIGPEP